MSKITEISVLRIPVIILSLQFWIYYTLTGLIGFRVPRQVQRKITGFFSQSQHYTHCWHEFNFYLQKKSAYFRLYLLSCNLRYRKMWSG